MLMSSKKPTRETDLRQLKTYHVGVVESAAHRALRKHKVSLLREYGLTGMQW